MLEKCPNPITPTPDLVIVWSYGVKEDLLDRSFLSSSLLWSFIDIASVLV